MNKIFLLVFLFLATLPLNSQDNISTSQWKAINQRIDSIDYTNSNLIENTNKTLERLHLTNSNVDSLERELLYFKVKEDYYSTALSDQSTRFTLIISGILALFAIVSFGAFKHEVRQIKKITENKIKEQNKSLKKYKNRLDVTRNDLDRAQGNLCITIGMYYEDKNMYLGAFQYYILALDSICRSLNFKQSDINKTQEDPDFTVIILNLQSANQCLSKITKAEDIVTLRQMQLDLRKSMDLIYKLDNELIKVEISAIRIKLTTILKSAHII